MTYTYDAGTTTPGHAGLIEYGGVRINSGANGVGTFKLTRNPLLDSPPVRLPVVPLQSDSGGMVGPTFYDPWQFTVEGWLYVPSGPDDVPPAIDQLRGAFAAWQASQQLTFNMRGWANRRFVNAQVNGPITIQPRHATLRIPTRDFFIPMVAADPIAYNADSQHSITLAYNGSSVQLPNNGNTPVSFAVVFGGSCTNPALFDDSSGASIALNMTLVGAPVTVNTNPVTGPSVIDSFGTNDYDELTAFTLLTIPPGTSRMFHATASSVTSGNVTVIYRDGWI